MKTNKAINAVQELKLKDRNYKEKIMILAKIINLPTTGHILPIHLIKWAKKYELITQNHCEDHISWWTVREK